MILPVPKYILEADPGVYPGVGLFSVDEWFAYYIGTDRAEREWQERTSYWRNELMQWSLDNDPGYSIA